MTLPVAAAASPLPIAASLLLAIYLAALAVLAPRELSFINSLPRAQRASFIVQDVLLQLCIFMVLVPALMLPGLGSLVATRFALAVIIAGFGLLWLTVIWMMLARQRYVHQLLRDATRESREQLEKLKSKLEHHQEDNGE
jgi:type VI protein secretion system component VasK